MRRRFPIGLLGVLSIASIAHAAQTVSVNPVADAFVAASNPTNNYGGAGGLALAASVTPKGEFQTVMRFDVAAMVASFNASFGEGNWQITGAALKLVEGPPNHPIFNANTSGAFAVRWMQDDSWIEGTGRPDVPTQNGVTFQTLPNHLAGGVVPLATLNYTGGTTTGTLSLEPAFASDVLSGGSVSLHLIPADNAVSYVFNSRNFATVAARPELSITVDAVPETASLGLVVALAICMKRRTR